MFSTEILFKIFSYLKPHEILQIQTVCKRWNMIGNDDIVWKKHSNTETRHSKRQYKVDYHWKWGKYTVTENKTEKLDFHSSCNDIIATGAKSQIEIRTLTRILFTIPCKHDVYYIKLFKVGSELVLLVSYSTNSIDLFTLDFDFNIHQLFYAEEYEGNGKIRFAVCDGQYIVMLHSSLKAYVYKIKSDKLDKCNTFYCENDYEPVAIGFKRGILFAFGMELIHGWEPMIQQILFDPQIAHFNSSKCLRRSRQIDYSKSDLTFTSTDYFDPFTARWETEPSSYAPPSSILYSDSFKEHALIFGHKDGSIHVHHIFDTEIIQFQVEYEHFSKITAISSYGGYVVTCSKDRVVVWKLICGKLFLLYYLKHCPYECPIWCDVTDSHIILFVRSNTGGSRMVVYQFSRP
jgi:hypothetical protein